MCWMFALSSNHASGVAYEEGQTRDFLPQEFEVGHRDGMGITKPARIHGQGSREANRE